MNKVYEIVQEKILNRLEEAIKTGEKFEWVKPWKGEFPKNFVSQKPYRGINLLLLPFGGYYMSFKQIKEAGGTVKKGSKAFPIFFFSYVEKKNNKNEEDVDNEKTRKVPIFKFYNVFHQSQIEGIDFPEIKVRDDEELNNEVEKMIAEYSKMVSINTLPNCNEACYIPKQDRIIVPKNKQFKNANMYYSALFHEMIHSTGHESRLNRNIMNKFGDEDYSKEELVAEIGASLLRAYFNITDCNAETNSVAYLQSWYDHIKNGNINTITIAAQQAQKATDFIINNTIEVMEVA